jgi:endonuclease YncB( thermonuclease family)
MAMPEINDLYWYAARPTGVTDGDTVVFEFDKGMRDRSEEPVRIEGLDTPELRSGDDRVRAAEAMRDVVEWLAHPSRQTRWPILIHTVKDKRSFNRYRADVYDANTGESLADYLRTKGWT